MQKLLTLRTSTAWPWSSRPCGISGIELRLAVLIVLLAFAFLSCASATTIQSGADIQAAISKASPGDTILVGPGDYISFNVDKPLTIVGVNGPMLRASIQKPAITIDTDGVSVSGFKIEGVGKDSESKFEYYMNNPAAASGMALNTPNAAIIVKGNDAQIKDTVIFGAQAGVFADTVVNISLQNNIFESCGQGVDLRSCLGGKVDGCSFSNSAKSGVNAEHCSQIVLSNNSIMNATHVGLLLKESEECSATNNSVSGCREGIGIVNTTFTDVRRNRLYRNWYGIVVYANNNTIEENFAEDNRQSDVIAGFGVGIHLMKKSSDNIVSKNTIKKNYNGIELTTGCQFNAVYGNNFSENTNALRLDKNRNNLVYGNNFIRNTISGYDNASRNTWNTTTFGNYYSDYRGKDEDKDGIGDVPYDIPKGDHDEVDARPLMKPFSAAAMALGLEEIMAEVKRYAKFGPADDEFPDYKVEDGTIVISSRVPTSPPKWPDSKSIFE